MQIPKDRNGHHNDDYIMDDAHACSDVCGSVCVDAFYRWNFVHPVRPIAMEWDLSSISIGQLATS
jgi:hypothetical protein